MPFPPHTSRAQATVSRHLAVQNAFESAACASVSFPSACQLGRARDQALRGRNVRKHLGQKILHELERADRPSELQALLGVLESILVSPHGASRCFPADEISGPTQNLGRVSERLIFLKTVLLRDPAVLHRDLTVLDHLEGNLVLNLFDLEARRGLVLDDESLDLVVGHVARPNDGNVAPRRVTDPSFLAIDDPGVTFTLRRRCQAARCSGTYQRFREAEAADLFEASHGWQPLLFLFFRAAQVDGRHCQAAVYTEEGRDRRVDACHLHGNQAGEQPATASAAVALQANAPDAQFLKSPAVFQMETHLQPNIS